MRSNEPKLAPLNFILLMMLMASFFFAGIPSGDSVLPHDSPQATGVLDLADDHDQDCLLHQLPGGCGVCLSCSLLDSSPTLSDIEGSGAVVPYSIDLSNQLALGSRFRPPTYLANS